MNTDTPEAPGPQPQTPAMPPHAARSSNERPRPRTSPIVWGAIVLAFCAFSAAQLIAPGALDGSAFVIATIIALGVLMLVVSIVVIARNAHRSKR